MKQKSGKIYAVEKCSCGHSRIMHGNTVELCHGECLVTGCDCKHYTWTDGFKFIRMENPLPFMRYFYGHDKDGKPVIGKRIDQCSDIDEHQTIL